MANGAETDVGLCQGTHLDRGLDAGAHSAPLQSVLQGQGVDHGGQHPHVIGGGPLHSMSHPVPAPPDVAGSQDDGDLDAEAVQGSNLLAERLGLIDIDPTATPTCQRLSPQLQEDPPVAQVGHRRLPSV